MIRVSFRWTWPGIQQEIKTETRRIWKPAHAAKFESMLPGTPFLAIEQLYKKDVRQKIVNHCFIYREALGDMSDESFEREAVVYCGLFQSKDEMIEKMGGPEKVLYVVRFDYL